MGDAYQFWRDQLKGLEPETTPGTPHAGFYRGGSSGAKYKRKVPLSVVAIWQDETDEWIARTDRKGAAPVVQRGCNVDEFVFPRVCRNAISRDEYLKALEEMGDEPSS